MSTQNFGARTRAPLVLSLHSRWWQLLCGLVCAMVASNPQYIWTLLTRPLTAQLGVSLPGLQVTFSILIVCQTFLSPLEGYLIERFGPRWLLSAGGAITGLSWVLTSRAESLLSVYLCYGVLGGIGVGIVVVGTIGLMARWFPDRRGFAIGVVMAGFGMGAMLTTFPITNSIARYGYQHTLVVYGVILGVVGILAALGMRLPPPGYMADWRSQRAAAAVPDTRPGNMLRTPLFWLMFVMMSMMATSGLMVTSQMAVFTRDFGMAGVTVFGLAALPLALTIDRVANGVTRPMFGWISDLIGREHTMLVAFGMEAIAMTLWLTSRHDPLLFVLLSGVVFLGWGEIFSLFPSTLTDTFGGKHAIVNYACLSYAQGIGSILGGPVAALLHEHTGGWDAVFGTAIALDSCTAVLAIAALKPMRRAWFARASSRS
ncbi:oxalate/formate MFS antiporter [Paraburkholderia kirstenboschensis]|uniref:Oxalate/formate MFS antiporter n=1 Tax=Paraburkholderia kirstenboschensis TaxID=1245436 RepID=A0ABZ0E9D2_9BURK|nr:oxalate/formate MFS antiporter [Paraburkholderia kirstenboschensis]WOD13871.1 oxalate/formate MFS antiporter [Paraburkholderia kirstenboschensis]